LQQALETLSGRKPHLFAAGVQGSIVGKGSGICVKSHITQNSDRKAKGKNLPVQSEAGSETVFSSSWRTSMTIKDSLKLNR
jgi:hypothetical protein